MRFSWLKQALPLLIGLVAPPGEAGALVGPSSEHGPLEAHVVMILSRQGGGAAFCSGAVIARDVVLTAAHCVNGAANTLVFYRDGAGQPATLAIATIAVHPEYRKNAIATRQRSIDLALARLATPLPAFRAPATLSMKGTIEPGDRFRVAGYGLARENIGSTGGVFRWGFAVAREPLSKILLWAEDAAHHGFGACTGDSGGPIFAVDDNSIVAVVNWSTGPTRQSHCGALTQGALIAPQRDWIDGVMRGWNAR